MTEKLKVLYYDTKTGFRSLTKLWERVKEQGIPVSYNDVKRFLEQQKPSELHKQVVRPKEFSNVYADHPLQCTHLDIMIYARNEIHNYKYIIGVIDIYSRCVACRAMTNLRMKAIMDDLKDMFENDFEDYPENINCDNEFNNKEFVDYFTSKGTQLWFSQPDQPHKNSVIERLWGTLAKILERMRTGIKNFDWTKALPDVIENYNNTVHRIIKATPNEIWEGKKENPVERKVVESSLKKGDRVRIQTKKTMFSKGDVATFSRDIYQIIEKTDHKNTLRNLTTGKYIKQIYTDEELEKTFMQPEANKEKWKEKKEEEESIKQRLNAKPVLRPEETIAERREDE